MVVLSAIHLIGMRIFRCTFAPRKQHIMKVISKNIVSEVKQLYKALDCELGCFVTLRMTTNRSLMKRVWIILVALLLANTKIMAQKVFISIDGRVETATLVNNSATQALVERLHEAPITVELNSSGDFEIWGSLGFSLPTSNEQIDAQPGDIVLYNGSNICIFYGQNSWSYTRVGRIDGLSENELRTFLKAGERNISVTLSISSPTDFNKVVANGAAVAIHSLSGHVVRTGQRGIVIKNKKKYLQ